MAQTAWITPASLTDTSGSPTPFVNPNNALTQNGTFANCTLEGSAQPGVLVGTISGFNIPAGSTIDGIVVETVGYASFLGAKPLIQLDNGTDGWIVGYTDTGNGNATTVSESLPVSDSGNSGTVLAGGASTKPYSFNAQPTVAQLNGPLTVSFSADTSGNSTAGSQIGIDHFRLSVYYTSSSGPVNLAFSYSNTNNLIASNVYKPTFAGIDKLTQSPTAAASSGGVTQWVNPQNVYTSNNARATLTFPGSNATTAANFAYLNTTGYGFNIPTGSQILGIYVTIECFRSGGTAGEVRLETVQLLKAGSLVGTNLGNTSNLGTTEGTRFFGSTTNLWGTTWTAEEINSPNFGLSIRALGTTATTNRVANVDNVTVQVTWALPVPPSYAYENSGTGAQTYTVKYHAKKSYSNTGTGTQAYTVNTATPLAFMYENTGTGTQSYSARFDARKSYEVAGTGAQSYTPFFTLSRTYANTGTGTQAYAPLFREFKSYANTGAGSNAYVVQFAAKTSYSNTGDGEQAYTPSFLRPGLGYFNSGSGEHEYSPQFTVSVSYENTGQGSQSYTPTVPKPPVTGGSTDAYPQIMRPGLQSVHAPIEQPKVETKKRKRKKAEPKPRVVDQAAVDALKAGIQIEVPVDPLIAEGLEAARLLLEQERLARIEEEELQMVMVMALAHRRRSRFHRLIT